MNMYLWDNYKPEEINENIKYWVDLWDDLISNFNKRSYGLKLINPQLLIKDIIDEIEFNDFKNSENKKYFYNKLNKIIKDDPVIKKYFKTEFDLIRRNFYENKFYLKELCKEYENILISGEYFKKACFMLKQILLNPIIDKSGQENILLLTQHLIIDFIIKGYDLKTIQKFPENIFDKYIIRDKTYIETKFPYETNILNYKCNSGYDFESYTNSIKEEIDRLTIDNRLDRLISYYFAESKEVYFIFEVEGLKGDIDISVGPVNFYSPKIKQYIKETTTNDTDNEFFGKNEQQYFINAAIKMNIIDSNSSSNRAIEEIEKALDILKVCYDTDFQFEIKRETYLVVDMEGRKSGFNYSASYKDGIFRWIKSLDLRQEEPCDQLKDAIDNCGNYIFINANKQTLIENRISHSIHWFRKGTEAKSFEDKIVNYWVAIENLLDFKISLIDGVIHKKQKETKFALAYKLIPPFIISNYIYNVGWELYWYLRNLINTGQGDRKCLELPDNIIEDCNLNHNAGAMISLRKFIDGLPNLLPYINREIIKEKINYTYKFYSDLSFSKIQIEKYMDNIKDEILLLYRYRNKIVHNAHYDNTILPYYVAKARKYSVLVCGQIASIYHVDSNQSLEELFVNKYIKINELIEKINNNIKVDLFDIKL